MNRFVHAFAVLVLALVALAQGDAQESARVLSISEDGDVAYLVDSQGRTLYLNIRDAEGGEVEGGGYASTCLQGCAANWPAYTVESWPLPEGALEEELDGDLVGSFQRDDGSVQLTYAGWPLYRFVADRSPGDSRGQGVQGNWFMVSAEGSAIGYEPPEQTEADAATTEVAAIAAEVMEQGREAYATYCAACHGRSGEGGQGPALAGNAGLADTEAVVKQIHGGGHFMPAFGGMLSDQQLAAVSSYIRNEWGNAFGEVTEEQVAEIR